MTTRYIAVSVVGGFCMAVLLFYFLGKPKQEKPVSNNPLQSKKEITLPSPTITSIFANDHSWIATLSAEKIRILTATGDIIPARSVNYQVEKYNNPLWPYEKVLSVFQSKKSDITLINLETPLIKNCPVTVEGMIFCGDAKNIAGLTAIETTVASIANNHAGNHGIDGVEETKELLKKAHITVVGVDGPVYKDIRGVRFAFLGYNDITKPQPGIANAHDATIKKDIAQARKQADIVVVTYHWGVEYRAQPDEDQKKRGRATIDWGADLVIGNHPHWIQPIEFYKGKLITYAHGNFIFDQMWSQKTREGVIGRYVFYDNKLIDVEYLPLEIHNYGQAVFIEGEKAIAILAEMKKQSEILAHEKNKLYSREEE